MRIKKRAICVVFFALLVLFAVTSAAYADESTTTYGTAYKDLSPKTEIYAVTAEPGPTYPNYNAKWEPSSGVYYGRCTRGGQLPGGGYGCANASAMANESAVSFYYKLTDDYSLEYWSYLYGNLIKDGNRAFLVHLNFENEGTDCANVVNGKFDSKLKEDFTYLSRLKCPVFIRIGGEVNVWTDKTTPSTYIAAYRHIAEIGRTYGSNVALVFSPNYSSSNKMDMDSFYPGDKYVDWIGTSLYYNRFAVNRDTNNDGFYGVNTYGDAMLNIQQTVNLSKLHNKPIIVTENGSAWKQFNQDVSGFAAERVEKAYSFLTMVYPQIKCILYSDTAFGSLHTSYVLTDNPAVASAYTKAVNNNPTLRKSTNNKSSYYTPLSAYKGVWSGNISLAAYSYSSSKLTARWYVDNVLKATVSEYPYCFSVDTNTLREGNHTVSVRFSDGHEKSYGFYSIQYHTATKFRDVPGDAYYTDAVVWAVEKEITAGTSDKTFSPEDSCTRGQVVTFLWRAMGKPEPTSLNSPFVDVQDTNAYYYKAVLWAVEKNITKGITAKTFEPESTVTRGQFVTFLWRNHGEPGAAIQNPFKDVAKGAFYEKAVLWAFSTGVTQGTSANTFGPEESCKRGQVVTFLHRDMK